MKTANDIKSKVAELQAENKHIASTEHQYWNINTPMKMVEENNLRIEALQWALGIANEMSQEHAAVTKFAEDAKFYLGKSIKIRLRGNVHQDGFFCKVTGVGPHHFTGYDSESLEMQVPFNIIEEILLLGERKA